MKKENSQNFIATEEKKSSTASEQLLKLLDAKKLTMEKVRSRVRELGYNVSEPTFIKWMHDPFYMSIYEVKALSKSLHIKESDFINIVFGYAKIQVLTKIDAIAG